MNILRIDSTRDDIRAAMTELRRRLSPRGDVVSQEGRRRTMAAFGEPLSPRQVVERICRDVEERGLAAVLDYSARIDGVRLSSDSLRVPMEDLSRAHEQADGEFLGAVRSIRERIWAFQKAILHEDVRVERSGGISSSDTVRWTESAFACPAVRPHIRPRY